MTVLSRFAAFIAPGSVVLFTTIGPDGPRTRPVVCRPDPDPQEGALTIQTAPVARKVADVRADSRVTVSGPTPTGWFEIQADAVLVATEQDAAVLRVLPRAGRIWTVHSPAPRDSSVEEFVF